MNYCPHAYVRVTLPRIGMAHSLQSKVAPHLEFRITLNNPICRQKEFRTTVEKATKNLKNILKISSESNFVQNN